MKYYTTLFCCLVPLFLIVAADQEKRKDEPFGQLMLCPPGGKAFTMAWTLACEMKKRRKRDDHDVRSELLGMISPAKTSEAIDFEDQHDLAKRSIKGFRPATLSEIMKICCDVGCDIRDLLPYCGPF